MAHGEADGLAPPAADPDELSSMAGRSDALPSEDVEIAADAEHWRSTTPLAKAIRKWHDSLPPQDILALRANLQELAKSGITIGTACSGTDIIVLVLELLSDFWTSEYGVKVPLRHAFACESQPSVQKFLCGQFPSCEVVSEEKRVARSCFRKNKNMRSFSKMSPTW